MVGPTYSSASKSYPDFIASNHHLLVAWKVTINSGQVLAEGAVLGQITASSKYVLSASAAGDGSATPDLVLAEGVDASGGDVEAMAYSRGDFVEEKLTFGTGHTADSTREGLRAKGITLVKSTEV